MYLLDTDILANLLRRTPSTKLITRLASVPADQQFTSTIALGELIYVAQRLRTPALLEQLERLVPPNLPVLPFDADAARRYGELRAELEVQGVFVGDADLRMGAVALARGLAVATGKVERFQGIPGLPVENWLEVPVAVAGVSEGPASVPGASIECSLRRGSGWQQAGAASPTESASPGIRWIWPPESPDGQACHNNGGLS